MNINDLPSELLSRIFQYLHPREWLSGENVCKNWAAILQEFWFTIKVVDYESSGFLHVTFDDGRIFRLIFSDGGNCKNDEELLLAVLKRCGDHLEKLILRINQEVMNVRSINGREEAVLLTVPTLCKRLRFLSVNGYVSSMADSISLMCHDLSELEEFSVHDETYPGGNESTTSTADNTGDHMDASILVGDILSTCQQLRSLNVNFVFLPPPSIEACRRLSNLTHLEKICWWFWRPIAPEYVETFLSNLIPRGGSLRHLTFCADLKAPLNGQKCAGYFRQLAETASNLEILDFGCQLNGPTQEESGEIYYDQIQEAPWTFDILSALASFKNLRELTLRNFDLYDEPSMIALKNICTNLHTLCLQENYGVSGKLTWMLRSNLQNLRVMTINQAYQLSNGDVFELILSCPNLTTLSISNVGLSFKKLVLDTHAALHRCGDDAANYDPDRISTRLNLKLDTACGYIHDEAGQLKKINLCGLKLEAPGHSNVFIDRICRKLDEPKNVDGENLGASMEKLAVAEVRRGKWRDGDEKF